MCIRDSTHTHTHTQPSTTAVTVHLAATNKYRVKGHCETAEKGGQMEAVEGEGRGFKTLTWHWGEVVGGWHLTTPLLHYTVLLLGSLTSPLNKIAGCRQGVITLIQSFTTRNPTRLHPLTPSFCQAMRAEVHRTGGTIHAVQSWMPVLNLSLIHI